MPFPELITDRTQADVDRIKYLNSLGWKNMTEDERAEWMSGGSIPWFDENGERFEDITGALLDIRQGRVKGAYNIEDLNTVGEACTYLHDLIVSLGYTIPGYTKLRTNWSRKDIPTPQEMETYLATVEALKAVFQIQQELPESMEYLTYDGANNIEKVLVILNEVVIGVGNIFIRSGMPWAYAGVGYYIKN